MPDKLVIATPEFKPKPQPDVQVAASPEVIDAVVAANPPEPENLPVEEMLGHTRPEQIPTEDTIPPELDQAGGLVLEREVEIDPAAPLAHKKPESLAPHELELERQRLCDCGRLDPEGMTGGNLTRYCEIITELRKTRAGPAKSKKKDEPSLPSISLDDIPKL